MAGLYLIVIFISIWLSYRYLNRPLRQLLRGVRAVSSGDMDVTVPVTSTDELGELAESFNQMTGKLNFRTQQLSQTSNELKIKEAQLKVATLEERQRLARELHDSVSQALYGIALGARTARTQLERDPAKVVEPLDYVLSLAEAGLAEMRALIFELRPESLQNEGLLGALTKVSDAVRTRHKLDVVTSFCPEPNISLDAKEMLYRVTQEAIYNVIKHASATRIEVAQFAQLLPQVSDMHVDAAVLGCQVAAEYPACEFGLADGSAGAVVQAFQQVVLGTGQGQRLPAPGRLAFARRNHQAADGALAQVLRGHRMP